MNENLRGKCPDEWAMAVRYGPEKSPLLISDGRNDARTNNCGRGTSERCKGFPCRKHVKVNADDD